MPRGRKPAPKPPIEKPILLPYQADFLSFCDKNRYVIVRKARQTGLSMAAALVAVRGRLSKASDLYYVSRTENTASQFANSCKMWGEIVNKTAQQANRPPMVDLANSSQSTIRFFPHAEAPRGNQIRVMPGGTDVLRGLPGDVIWDEAAYAEDGQGFYDSTFPTTQWGHSFIIISTVGVTGQFYENEWAKPDSVFAKWFCPMSRAVEEGLADLMPGPHLVVPRGTERNKQFIANIKRGMSDDMYAQEYDCIQRGLGGLITGQDYDKQALFDVCDTMQEFVQQRGAARLPIGELFAGIDLAFTGDLASIWILERCWDGAADTPDEYRDCYRTVVAGAWRHLSPRALNSVLSTFLLHPNISKCVVDQGGPGYVLALDLQQKFGDMVECLAVTNAIKAEAYERVKWFLQVDRLGLPKDRADIREEFLSVMRKTTPKGSITYEGRTGSSHGDKFASSAYALFGATHDFESLEMEAK